MNERWTTRDIVVAAALAVAVGLVWVGWTWLWYWAQALFGQPAREFLGGFWIIGGVLVPYIIRKPGAAIVGEFVAALVELPLTPFGAIVLLAALIEGAGSELVFFLTRYRVWNTLVLFLAGCSGAAVFFVTYVYWVQGYGRFGLGAVALYFALRTLGGGVLAGLGARLLGDALAATGVLEGFAIARERRPAV